MSNVEADVDRNMNKTDNGQKIEVSASEISSKLCSLAEVGIAQFTRKLYGDFV